MLIFVYQKPFNMENVLFFIKTYLKRDLALLYFPGSTPETATKNLNRWIQKCAPLRNELEQLNYSPRRHSLLKHEVAAIVKHLGEP